MNINKIVQEVLDHPRLDPIVGAIWHDSKEAQLGYAIYVVLCDTATRKISNWWFSGPRWVSTSIYSQVESLKLKGVI